MIPYLLFYKIAQFFVFILLGFILVKLRIIKGSDSVVLSRLSLYLFMPAIIINSFDIELTDRVIYGFLLAVLAAVIIHLVLMALDGFNSKVLKCNGTERASVIYSNAGNIIVPIVSFVLGEEWVVYSCAFISVQQLFIWTHGIRLFSGNARFSIKKILNINIIAILIGVVMMVLGVRLPSFAKDITSSLGSMIGPVGMIIAGMLMADADFKGMLFNKRLYLISALRMIVTPTIMLLLLKLILMLSPVANSEKILLISFMACITPSASSVTQLAQVNNADADFAAAVNIFTTIICIATMPLFVALF